MKTSNLLGVLALGGIGYYLLKNKNKPAVSDFAQQISLDTTPVSAMSVNDTLSSTIPLSTATTSASSVSSNTPFSTATTSAIPLSNSLVSNTPVATTQVNTAPVTTTPISSNLASTSPVKIAPVTTTPISAPSPKIETALAPLGMSTATTSAIPLSNSLVSNTPVATTQVNTAPVTTTTPISSNLASTSPVKIAPVTTTPISTPIPKIETALVPLGIETNCGVPTDGWDKNILEWYMYNSPYHFVIKPLIVDPQLKESGNMVFVDSCGNVYLKNWQHLVRSYLDTNKVIPNGMYHGELSNFSKPTNKIVNGHRVSEPISFYIKGDKLYILPSNLIKEYRNKYLAPLQAYLKRLPKMDFSDVNERNPIYKYPENGEWQITPVNYNVGGYKDYIMEQMMEAPLGRRSLSEMASNFLVNNPQARNRYGFYIDQFGNMVNDGKVELTASRIAEYRINHGIPF